MATRNLSLNHTSDRNLVVTTYLKREGFLTEVEPSTEWGNKEQAAWDLFCRNTAGCAQFMGQLPNPGLFDPELIHKFDLLVGELNAAGGVEDLDAPKPKKPKAVKKVEAPKQAAPAPKKTKQGSTAGKASKSGVSTRKLRG
jgi:hypothetical protein